MAMFENEIAKDARVPAVRQALIEAEKELEEARKYCEAVRARSVIHANDFRYEFLRVTWRDESSSWQHRAFVFDLGMRVIAHSVHAIRTPVGALHESFGSLIEWLVSRDHAIYVAVDDLTYFGFALAVFDMPDDVTMKPQAFIAYLAVEPAYRRQGIARALMAEVGAEARARGLPYMSLMVNEQNGAALTLYESLGFVNERRQMTRKL